MFLFLDFDGVLHPDPCPRGRLFEHARALSDALAPHAVDIVLSTTWRRIEPLEALKARLPPPLAARVIDITPSFSDISGGAGRLYPYPRQAECLAWLQQREAQRQRHAQDANAHDAQSHNLPHNWHALDDRAEWFEPYCERLTLCDARVGLTTEALAHLSSALERARSLQARSAHRSPPPI
jgi:hypothetical protein